MGQLREGSWVQCSELVNMDTRPLPAICDCHAVMTKDCVHSLQYIITAGTAITSQLGRADGTVRQGRRYGLSISPAGSLSSSYAKQDAVQGRPSMIWLGALGWILHYHCQISIIY